MPVGCNECAGKSAVIMGPGVFLGDVFHAARGRVCSFFNFSSHQNDFLLFILIFYITLNNCV